MNISNSAIVATIIDIIGIIVCFLIVFDFSWGFKKNRQFDNILFRVMVGFTVFIFFNDAISYLCEGSTSRPMVILNYFANTNYILLTAFVSVTWITYLFVKLNYPMHVIKKWLFVIALPNLIVAFFALCSFSNKMLFYIDENNMYQRGPYYSLMSLSTIIYVTISFIFIAIKMKASNSYDEKHSAKVLLSYVIFPTLGLMVHFIANYINGLWIFTSISYLIIYFNLQNSKVTTDFLTGLNNRRKFQDYAKKRLIARSVNEMLYLLVIDLNKFKAINDMYGHLTGDDALISFSKVLLKSVNSNDFVARIGGDEFVVFGRRDELYEIEALKNNLIREVDSFNFNSDKLYELSVSIGATIITGHKNKTLEQLLSEADCEMYTSKLEFWKREKLKQNKKKEAMIERTI